MHRLLPLAVLLLSHRAEASGGFLPPLEIEVGGVLEAGDQTHAETSATQVLVGLSWASLYPKSTPIDITFGIETITPHEDRPSRVARGDLSDPDGTAFGGYLDAGVAIHQVPHLRAFVGGRGELLRHDDRGLVGAVAHLSVELWKGACVTDHGGGIIGTLAVSVWSEAGVRGRTDGSTGAVFATGIGVRLPLVAVH